MILEKLEPGGAQTEPNISRPDKILESRNRGEGS